MVVQEALVKEGNSLHKRTMKATEDRVGDVTSRFGKVAGEFSRQANGTWDVWTKNLTTADAAQALTTTPEIDEVNPTIDWPWVVYQTKPASSPSAPWQLMARNLVTGQTSVVDAGPQDQLDPEVQAGRVVWQDHREVGFGEIYLKHLETNERRRITTNTCASSRR